MGAGDRNEKGEVLGFPGCYTSGCYDVNWESGFWGRERIPGQKDLLCREGSEQGMDDIKRMGSCGNGCCMPWTPLLSNAPNQSAFVQMIFVP